jgi:uncharacterized protein (DUF2147 family)
MRLALAFLMMFFAALAGAADRASPVGLWKTIDDKTQQPRSLVRIVDAAGVLEGRIEQILNRQPDDDPENLCRACKGDRKDRPVIGMKILWGLVKDGDAWEDGEILDPKNGKTYSCKMRLSPDGSKLEVRGFIGLSLIGRSQTWIREE